MYLLHLLKDGSFGLEDFSGKEIPPYIILSHRWGGDNEEVTFRDIKDGTGREKKGYRKLCFCANQAARAKLIYFWVDTCCIDRSNSTELHEAIITMFKWYQNAACCYVYLSDVSSKAKTSVQMKEWESEFKRSEWFTRGWTLQELIAPRKVQFFSKEEDLLGTKATLLEHISDATGIRFEVLQGKSLLNLSYEERTSWAMHRVTRRPEDAAYSLFGILDIHMIPQYGEGLDKAMNRLRREFYSARSHPDHTIANVSKSRTLSKGMRLMKKPDRHPTKRPLCRFYEPLVLLYTLGSTKEDYIPSRLLSEEDTLHLPLRTRRRNFLEDLAYMCDYDSGHHTATAIGMQSMPQRHVLWIASNSSPTRRIVNFVRSLLDDMRLISTGTNELRPVRTTEFITACIEFARSRIEDDFNCLLSAFQKCKDHLEKYNPTEASALVEWIRSWVYQPTLEKLCRYAYQNLGSTYMHTLARLSSEIQGSTNQHGPQNPFDLVRHHMRQIGRRFQAAKALPAYGSRLPELSKMVEVFPIETPLESEIPAVDPLVNFDSIAIRMLPNDHNLARYQQALKTMDDSHDLFEHFLHNYVSGNAKPYVHAEVQVLDWFHTSQFEFVDDDPFIACSRPVCLPSLAYFKAHSGTFVEPHSDLNVCLSWRPPVIDSNTGGNNENDQRDTLNGMNEIIRKETLYQILKKACRPHNGSTFPNRALVSGQPEQHQKLSVQSELLAQLVGLSRLGSQPSRKRIGGAPADVALVSMSSTHVEKVNVRSSLDHADQHTKLSNQSRSLLDEFIDDSEDEGGILL